MNQPEVVVRGSVRWIECRRFEVLPERRPRPMTTHDVAEVTTQQHEYKEQQKRRTSHSRKQMERERRDKLRRKTREQRYRESPRRRHPERVFNREDHADAEQHALKHDKDAVRQENRILKLVCQRS